MTLDTLHALLEDQLKDLYSAELQLTKALPKMARKSSSDELREAIELHLDQTRDHAERLQDIAGQMGLKLGGKRCRAMEGLIEEGREALESDGEEAIIDAAIIASAQRVEHYEIAGYGTARSLANHLGLEEVAQTLQEILDEEGETDKKLTALAIEVILPATDEIDAAGAERERRLDRDDIARAGGGRGGRAGPGRSASRGGASRAAAGRNAGDAGGRSRAKSGGRSNAAGSSGTSRGRRGTRAGR